MENIKVKYDTNPRDVQKFKEIGEFENNLSDFGFIQINKDDETSSSNETYVKFELKNLKYDESRILDTNSIEFGELSSAQTDRQQDIDEILTQYNMTLAENKNLNEIVNGLIEKYENNNDKSIISVMKTQIIELRILLGQGNYLSDFQDTFPFLPVT
jgi:hypothetical protein